MEIRHFVAIAALAGGVLAALCSLDTRARPLQLLGLSSGGGGGGAFAGAGDAVSGATAFWGLRAYNAAYATALGPLANLGRVADAHTCDITADATTGHSAATVSNCSTGGDNGTARATWCASGCNIQALYEQRVGGNLKFINANNPAVLNFSGCPSSVASCIAFTSSPATTLIMANPFGSSIPQPYTVSMAASCTTGGANGVLATEYGAFIALLRCPSLNQMQVSSGTSLTVTMSYSAFHSVQAVFGTGGAGTVYVDGATTTGPVGTAAIDAAQYAFGGDPSSPLDGFGSELIIYPFALSSGQATALTANQRGTSGWNF